MKPIPLSQLLDKPYGYAIRCIEGVLIVLSPEKNAPDGGWVLQGGCIKDGDTTFDILFNHRSTIQPLDVQGKTIRIHAGTRGNSFRGLTLNEDRFGGQPRPVIKVSDGARIEIVEQSTQKYEEKPQVMNVIDQRIDTYFKVFDRVHERYKQGCSRVLESDQLKDIATHICMSFKDRPEVYESIANFLGESPQAQEEGKIDWTQFNYKGKLLSELEPDKLKGLIFKAFCTEPGDGAIVDNLYDAARSVPYSPEQCFNDLLTRNDIDLGGGAEEEFWKDNFNFKSDKLSQEDYLTCFRYYGNKDNLINAIQKSIDDSIPF